MTIRSSLLIAAALIAVLPASSWSADQGLSLTIDNQTIALGSGSLKVNPSGDVTFYQHADGPPAAIIDSRQVKGARQLFRFLTDHGVKVNATANGKNP